jgi:hypothetical protein
VNYEHQNKNKIENLAPEHRTVERVPGVGPCVAWELSAPGEELPLAVRDALLEQANDGKRVLLNAEFTDEGTKKGLLFSVSPAEAGRALQFAMYVRDGDEIRLTSYDDSKTLGVRRMQQDELTHRFITVMSGMKPGEDAQLPHERVDFAAYSRPVAIDKIVAAVGIEDAHPDAGGEENYTFARLQAAIVDRLDLESEVAASDETARIARRGLFGGRFRRKK